MDDIQNSKKKYNKIPKPENPVRVMTEIWCHQCKMKKSEVICCDNFFKKNKQGRCNGKYCDSCMQRHYATSLEDLRDLNEWTCFKCTQMCVCASCKRERGDNVPVKKRRKRKSRKYDMPSSPVSSPPSYVESAIKKQRVKRNAAIDVYVPKSSIPLKEVIEEPKEVPQVEDQRRMSHIDVLAETASQIIVSSFLSKTDPTQINREEVENSNSITSSPCCDKNSDHSQEEEDVCPHCKENVFSLKKQVTNLQQELSFLKETLKNYGLPTDETNLAKIPAKTEVRGRKNLFVEEESPDSSPRSYSPGVSINGFENEYPRISSSSTPSSNFDSRRYSYDDVSDRSSSFCEVSFQDFSNVRDGKRWSLSHIINESSIPIAN